MSAHDIEARSSQDAAKNESEKRSDDPETVLIQNPYFTEQAPLAASEKKKLPPWLDHLNVKDMKKLFKCSLAVWIMTLLILINPTLNAIGPAAFLGCIVLFLAPPAGILFMQLLMAFSVLIGLGLGWAWGVIAMKAALAARPSGELDSRNALLQQMTINATKADPSLNPQLYAKQQVLNGFMLDTRVTIVYYCMVGLFIYLIARVRVAVPKLILVQMMASIVSIVFLTEAPLLPTFDGTIAKTLVIPAAIAAGLGIVCNIFVFPISSSTEVLDGFQGLMAPMPEFLDACLLGFQNPRLKMDKDKLVDARLKILKDYKALEPTTNFLPLDFSVGKWNPAEIASLGNPLRRLIISFIGLVDVHRTMEERKELDEEVMKVVTGAETGRHQVDRERDFRLKSNPAGRDELVEKSLQALSHSSSGIIEACKESLAAICGALVQAKLSSKTAEHQAMLQKHSESLKQLKERRESFIELASQHLLGPHDHLFNEDGLLKTDTDVVPSLTGLMFALLLEERLSQLADALDVILTKIIQLETTRIEKRLWMPGRLMALTRWLSRSDEGENPMMASQIGDTLTRMPTIESSPAEPESSATEKADERSARSQLISMRKPNSRKRTKASLVLLKITGWLTSTGGIFALRLLVLTVALSVPAVIHSSSGFYYREKGLWAVIMGQLVLVPYTADLVYGIIVRAAGTIIGGVAGMVAWYIGAGNGPGNPYGMAAILAVVIILFMWWRLWAPPALVPAGIMMGATAYLVAAYSWIDSHNPTYGNPGVGYEVFWRRIVLVFIGFGASLIVNFLPKPPSANRHYRNLLADSLASVRDRCALLVSNWKSPPSDLSEVVEEEALLVGEALLMMTGPVKLTVLEFSTSNFDTNTLSRVCELCMILNQTVTRLLLYTSRLPEQQRMKIIPSTGIVDEDLIAELMAVLSLVHQTLKSGDPLPAVLPTPLFTKTIGLARGQIQESLGATDAQFDRQRLSDEGLRKFVAILNSGVQMLRAVDELVLVLKAAIGETSNIYAVDQV